MAKWQIETDEYFERLNLKMEDFEKRLGLPKIKDVRKIVSLRDMHIIDSIVPIKNELFLHLLQMIPTLDGRTLFKDAKVRMIKIDPRHLKIGQKFVYREKYQQLMEDVPGIFGNFLTTPGGLSDLGAYFVFGVGNHGSYCMACYIPPIIEKHGEDLIITDGIHRDYLAMQAGSTPVVLLVENVSLPFPCAVRSWGDIKVISLSEKPDDISDRYFDLNKNLFRDLKYLGIDG